MTTLELDLKEAMGQPVFTGVPEEKMEMLTTCLLTEKRAYAAGETILPAGIWKQTGTLLSGRVEYRAPDGSVFQSVEPGQLFGKGPWKKELMGKQMSVVAAEDTVAILFDHQMSLDPCWFCCYFHSRVAENVMILGAVQEGRCALPADFYTKK